MCQGVIVTVVRFTDHKTNKIRRSVLTGVGSHSDLLRKSQMKLRKMGYDPSEIDNKQSIESFESNFNKGFGGFKYAGGIGDSVDPKEIQAIFNRIAGSPSKLIKFVKKQKIWDKSLAQLLTKPAYTQLITFQHALDQKYYEKEQKFWNWWDHIYSWSWLKCTISTVKHDAQSKQQLIRNEQRILALWCRLFANKRNRVPKLK